MGGLLDLLRRYVKIFTDDDFFPAALEAKVAISFCCPRKDPDSRHAHHERGQGRGSSLPWQGNQLRMSVRSGGIRNIFEQQRQRGRMPVLAAALLGSP